MKDNNPADNIVHFQNVSSGYLAQNVLTSVDFSILKGEFVYLIGKTGSGKSSILKMIYADLRPRTGAVFVAGKDTSKLSKKEVPFLRRKLGIVFQDFQLLPDRSVYENIRFALRATGWTDQSKISNRISEVLVKVGLSSKLKSMPHQLSGGEQQRVTIARALINDPVLILADEPTGNLDPEATQNIMEILFRINMAGTAVLMATHEHNIIRTYPARTLECRDGGIADLKMTFS